MISSRRANYQGELALMVTYISRGRKSSAPASRWFSDIDALSNMLLINLQQLMMHMSFSPGALKELIFCSSFAATWEEVPKKKKEEEEEWGQNS